MLINTQRRRIDRAIPADAPLALDFERSNFRVLGNSVSIDSILATTRSSVGYVIGDGGPFVSVGANKARISRRGRDGGLVVEEAKTNLLLQSCNMATSPWNMAGLTATNAGGAVGPDGLKSASICVDNAPAATSRGTLSQPVTIGATTRYYAASIFVRPAIGFWRRYRLELLLDNGATTASAFAVFDFDTGAVRTAGTTGSTNLFAGVEPAPLGYYRIWVSCLNSLGAGTLTATLSRDLDASTPIAFDAWGAQIENDSSPTSPILTTSAPVTRAADVCAIDLTSLLSQQWFGQDQGSFIIDATLNGPLEKQQTLISADGGGGNMLLAKAAATSNGIFWQGFTSEFQALGVAENVATPLPRRIRAACCYFYRDWLLAVGGGQYEYGSVPYAGETSLGQYPIVDCLASYPGNVPGSFTTLGLGQFESGGQLNGRIHRLAYVPWALSAADLTGLVT